MYSDIHVFLLAGLHKIGKYFPQENKKIIREKKVKEEMHCIVVESLMH